MDKIEKEKFIRKIFRETGSTSRDAKNLANALKNVTGDLYTETELNRTVDNQVGLRII